MKIKAVIDHKKCNACKECIDICLANNIVYSEDTGQVHLKNLFDCQGCEECSGICPEEAIDMVMIKTM